MSAEEILADLLEVRWGTTANWAAHVLEDLKAAGYAVVELPDQESTMWRWAELRTGGLIEELFTEEGFLTADEAREKAGVLLAAADAAEVSS